MIDVPCCTPEERARILANYRDRLDAIAAYANRIGAVPILVVPAGNDAGYEPNRSYLPPETPAAVRAEFARRFQEARAAEANDPSRALALFAP